MTMRAASGRSRSRFPFDIALASAWGLVHSPRVWRSHRVGIGVVVANFENDSVSIVDLGLRAVSEVELRPGKIDPQQRGVPGGEFPFWVTTKGDDKAYVTSMRDREVAEVGLPAPPPRGVKRINGGGETNRKDLERAGRAPKLCHE